MSRKSKRVNRVYRFWDQYKWIYYDIHKSSLIFLNSLEKDKKGNDIYEGDIVILDENNETKLGVIKFGEYNSILMKNYEILGFYVNWIFPSINNENCCFAQITNTMEVIGNVHEGLDLSQDYRSFIQY